MFGIILVAVIVGFVFYTPNFSNIAENAKTRQQSSWKTRTQPGQQGKQYRFDAEEARNHLINPLTTDIPFGMLAEKQKALAQYQRYSEATYGVTTN